MVKKLLTADLSKRYGNLKAGADDIINHKWFATCDWAKMAKYQVPAPFKPPMKDANDYSNFENVPESNEVPPAVTGANDPFAGW